MVRENIAKYIKDNGIKQIHIAKALGISPSAVSLIVNCERDLSAEEYVKICKLFKVSCDYFVHDNIKPDKPNNPA